MDTSSLEKFALAARHALEEGVAQRLYALALDDDGRRETPAGSDVVRGRVLSNRERAWRDVLLAVIDEEGLATFSSRMAYTWFNRLLAIRYMEVHGFLPCRMRMLSNAEGAFEPEVLARPFEVEMEGLDAGEVAAIVASGDDEALFRCFLLAQVNELAAMMPQVFGEVGAAESLTLPDNLLSRNDGNAVYLAVRDLPEHPVDGEGEPLQSVWWPKDEDGDADPTEILGWLYQFYNAEARAEYNSSKRKATEEDLPVATQLFTPRWIVRYLVENSLGRLWLESHPGSRLKERVPYYVAPEEGEGGGSPADPVSAESITLCDPASGSGHMLGYAFGLLCAMYEEEGYRPRDVPALILEKNLQGFEVDPRAAQIAAFRLLMLGREQDRRMLSRGVEPKITVFGDVRFEDGPLEMTALEEDPGLRDVLAHLGEVGSLWRPTEGDVATLRTTAAQLSDDDIFERDAKVHVERALACADALSQTFDVVVTNPPYMGSSKFNPWMSKWVKRNYPDSKSDLCTCFIERTMGMLVPKGYAALATSNSWMFLSSFEKLRNRIIDGFDIETLVQLSVQGFKGIAAQVMAFVISKGYTGAKGGYIRLNEFNHHSLQEPKALEAIQNPDCGWFYRADASRFHEIPGSPIAYWASDAVFDAFRTSRHLKEYSEPKQGLATSNNSRFLRAWWEVSETSTNWNATSRVQAMESGVKWFPIVRGGSFRKWFGNQFELVDWENDGDEIKKEVLRKYPYLNKPDFVVKNQDSYFMPSISWSKISSGDLSFRVNPPGSLFEVAGPSLFFIGDRPERYVLGLLNSSVISHIATILSPTMNYEVGQISEYPIFKNKNNEDAIEEIVDNLCSGSKIDWDSQETSWGFRRNPMV